MSQQKRCTETAGLVARARAAFGIPAGRSAVRYLLPLLRGGLPALLLSAVPAASQAPWSVRQEVAETGCCYVWAGAAEGGDGSSKRPFRTLSQVEEASRPGDAIFVSTAGALEPLDGGLALKPDQKLIGIREDASPAAETAAMARLTNTTTHLDGAVVQLSERNEIRGIHFVDLRGHGIHGAATGAPGTDYSGAWIHHDLFSGAQSRGDQSSRDRSGGGGGEDLDVAVLLEAATGAIRDVRVTDCEVRDGQDLAGIRVMHTGDSSGEYQLARNRFFDLGGRAYLIWSRGNSHIESQILDSIADNIGRGNRNSDSIDPRLWGHSQQQMLVRNYHYANSKRVGNRSNTGLEAFLMGAPFPNSDEWCDGCRLHLEVVDSVFEGPITDGIQITNYGSRSLLDVEIRSTKVLNAEPQQAGGAIAFIAQNERNTGSRSSLLLEGCDLVGSQRYGVVITDRSGEATATVDLGGGALGSRGGNRILGSGIGELHVIQASAVARHNWWGGGPPRVTLEGEVSSVELEPALEADPRPK